MEGFPKILINALEPLVQIERLEQWADEGVDGRFVDLCRNGGPNPIAAWSVTLFPGRGLPVANGFGKSIDEAVREAFERLEDPDR